MMIILCGRDGAGKTTLAKELIKSFGFRKFPSVTTRDPRLSDLPGEYEYVTNREFDARLGRNEFAWWKSYRENRYGTARIALEEALQNTSKQWVDILVPEAIDMHQAYATKVGASNRVLYIYLRAEESTLRERLESRRETRAQVILKINGSRHFEDDVKKRARHFTIVKNDHMTPAETARYIFNLEETHLALRNPY